MKELDFMQARKELQEKLGKSYIVRVNLTDKKHLEIRSKIGILDMECIGNIFWYCKIHHLKYFVCIDTGGFPTFNIYL